MLMVPLIHETPERASLLEVASRLVAVRQDMRDVELRISRLTRIAARSGPER